MMAYGTKLGSALRQITSIVRAYRFERANILPVAIKQLHMRGILVTWKFAISEAWRLVYVKDRTDPHIK